MTKLLSAYVALGLPAGSSLACVLRRHRWLACAFHPDRMPETKKAAAEQEMKRINNARDELTAHYMKCHRRKDETCRCEPFYAPCDCKTRDGSDFVKPTGGGAGATQTDSRRSSCDTENSACSPLFDWHIKTDPKPDNPDALQRFGWRLLLVSLVLSIILTVVDRVEEVWSGRADTNVQAVQQP